jgi:hypothetical protein
MTKETFPIYFKYMNWCVHLFYVVSCRPVSTQSAKFDMLFVYIRNEKRMEWKSYCDSPVAKQHIVMRMCWVQIQIPVATSLFILPFKK